MMLTIKSNNSAVIERLSAQVSQQRDALRSLHASAVTRCVDRNDPLARECEKARQVLDETLEVQHAGTE